MTRTVAETDGLLEALSAVCRARDAARRERHDALVAHRAAEAECAELRAKVDEVTADWDNARGLAERSLELAVMAGEERDQARRELARATRPSAVFTLGHLVGVAIGAALVGGAAGVEVALRWLPW